MKRYIKERGNGPARYFTSEYTRKIFNRIKRFLYIDRGSWWSDPEEGDIPVEACIQSDDVANPWHDFGYREIAWMPSFNPDDEYEFHQWASLTFEEFLAYFNIIITEKYPERAA